jgi:hypothetical protein
MKVAKSYRNVLKKFDFSFDNMIEKWSDRRSNHLSLPKENPPIKISSISTQSNPWKIQSKSSISFSKETLRDLEGKIMINGKIFEGFLKQ